MLKSSTARGAIATAFKGQRRLRQWRNNHFGSIDAVKIWPLSICRFRPDEGGTVSTKLDVKLAPVSGYMRSNAYVEVVQVFVPYQAIEKLEFFEQADAGVTEMTRRRLMAGEAIGMAPQTPISRAANVHPRRVGGEDRVSHTIRLAYNAAVNHLRRYAYYDADQLNRFNTLIAPAILSANALERFNGVLEPERNIDGAINLTGELPVKGIAFESAELGAADAADYDHKGPVPGGGYEAGTTTERSSPNRVSFEADPVTGYPKLRVNLDGTNELTLRDMMKSQILDGLIRQFADMIEKDPINGEQVVERALYGLSVDYDHNCQVMYRQTYELTPRHARPMDGASFNDVSAHFALEDETFTTLVPRSELGGQLVTLVSVKPLETIEAQPDPAQTEAWTLVNRVHDEMELDEELLTRADLESGVSAANEDQPVFWVGHNSLKHAYSTRGANQDRIADVEMKSSMWTFPVPSSVTPENISYPSDGIDMYPFYNWNGGHAEYTIDQVAAISTQLAKGPSPVERIQIFADDPSLIEDE